MGSAGPGQTQGLTQGFSQVQWQQNPLAAAAPHIYSPNTQTGQRSPHLPANTQQSVPLHTQLQHFHIVCCFFSVHTCITITVVKGKLLRLVCFL